MRVLRAKIKGVCIYSDHSPGCLWWCFLAHPSLGLRLLAAGQATCEVGPWKEAQGWLFPAGEEQQNYFESVAGRELPSLFEVPVAAALLLTALYRQPQPTIAERHLLLSWKGEFHFPYDFFYLVLCWVTLAALVSGALLLPLSLIFLNLIIFARPSKISAYLQPCRNQTSEKKLNVASRGLCWNLLNSPWFYSR